MRLTALICLLVLASCGREGAPNSQPDSPATATGASTNSTVIASKPRLIAIPDDPEAVKRLEAMGYTVHADEGHLHAPGVTNCPAMGESAVM